MLHRLQVIARAVRRMLARKIRPVGDATAAAFPFNAEATLSRLARAQRVILFVGTAGLAGWLLYKHFPVENVPRGDIGVRTNQLTGTVTQFRDGSVFVLPGLHDMRVYSLRDQVYRPEQVRQSNGAAPLQSVEGLSVGVDLTVRYALDPAKLATVSKNLPDNYAQEIVEPAVQGVIYKVFARYTVREIFSTRRAEIQQVIEGELKPRLAADGIVLRGVLMGKVDLPADYKRGMEGLLAEELETQKMRYTLELKEKRVKQTELEASAEKVQREVRAEAAAREQIIAAKAQEEAMKHVLPFKQRQIEQRQLEAEAEKQSRMKVAEGTAQARRIEASGEADARQKLAEVEAWRLDRIGKVNAEQMAREGALVTRHPLLIQKTMADKLSDKIQVIIAAPPSDGGFIGAALLGSKRGQPSGEQAEQQAAAKEEQ
ncbi:prohibitin family protein [Ramlibacter sp. WS9]|nr:prohibitin family protein [Ramlibacter sp. WS9]ROZ78736.1 prohibitin family protein [Ramlibacter sp. WS9]